MEPLSFLLYSLFLLIFTQALLHIKDWLFKKRVQLPPGPTGLPIIGSLLTLGDRPHESITKLAETYGPLMTVRLGFNVTVVASSAEMAREILQKNDQAFLGRPIPDAATAQTNYDLSVVWLPGNEKWRNLRKIYKSQIFATHRLDALQGSRHQAVDGMVRRVVEASEAGEAISIGTLVFGTTLNSLSNTIFSVDIFDPKSNAIQELKELIWSIMELGGKPNLSDFFPLLKSFDLQGIRRSTKVPYDRLHGLIDNMIDQRLELRASGSPRCDDLLDVLLDLSKEQGHEEFNRLNIKVFLTDFFIGGTDTTSATIEWAMTELLRNPDIMAKAKQELAETIGIGESIQEKDIPRLPYLQAVLKETMRLHPIAPFLLPRSLIDVEVCGYTIPKHTQVIVNAWAIARDPMYWDKPTQFKPERFIDSKVDFRGTNFSFMPFGSGRRICPGLDLAVRMLSLFLASLIHHFDWKLPDRMAPEDIDIKDKFGLTLQKAVALVAIPVVVAKAE
ncbi:hypothetical protein ACB098_05G095200 [Castanea mollissima]